MSEIPDKQRYYTNLFVSLLINLQSMAFQQMGKVKDPLTDKVVRNMEQAKFLIDTVDMLQAKTVNNLTADEKKIMEDILDSLKVAFVEEQGKDKKSETSDDSRKESA